jgi:selenocysteine lyase/cysteine desulfurase
MADFRAEYPEYEETWKIDELRATEYSYLNERGDVYLDYTGAGLAARSQLQAHAARIGAGCFGNPHSENPTSSASTRLVEQARATTRSSSRRTRPAPAALSARPTPSGATAASC